MHKHLNLWNLSLDNASIGASEPVGGWILEFKLLVATTSMFRARTYGILTSFFLKRGQFNQIHENHGF